MSSSYNLNQYITSTNLSVYPCGNRDVSIAPMDRLNTEYNIVSIVNRMVDRDSFVVSKNSDLGTYYSAGVESTEDSTSTVGVIFNIHGYIFRTNLKVGSIVELQPYTTTGEGDNQVKVMCNTYYLYAGVSIEQQATNLGQIINEMLPLATDANSGDAGWMDETLGGGFTNYFTGMKIVASDVLKQPYDTDEVYQWSMVGGTDAYKAANIFKEFLPSIEVSSYNTHIIPILKCEYSSGDKKLYLSIPEVSRVKFQTSKQGLYRSVTIDDGVI